MAELRRILHVDDEPDIREITQMVLEDIGGFETRTCASGAEALELAAGYAPDLVLLDVMMPGMDGPTTLGKLRERPETASLPVIFMTAKVQPEEIRRYQELGALGVVTKPFDPMTLSDRIRDLWKLRPQA